MLTYNMLSPGQKKWVMMVKMFHPEIKEEITFEQINKFHVEFLALREQDTKYKVGLPNWLLTNNRIGKGTYFFPDEGNEIKKEEPLPEDALTQKYVDYLKRFKIIEH